ncbi:TauD/TfdA family dioxygenase [Streptosporangium sp. NPDC002544]|uniref:TauD/TfdA dioxygenase family protein n=1 Tax=Streptosporangium sp. NPDC002544 TaxID=3154538 RepID=UPI00332C02DD
MTETHTLVTRELTPVVGAEVLDVDVDRLRNDEDLPRAVAAALEKFHVLLFRELHIDDETQVAFCKKWGPVQSQADFSRRLTPGQSVPEDLHPEIFEVSWNPDNPYGDQLRGNVFWHLDGILNSDRPTKAAMMSAKVVTPAGQGGETEFASSYGAYDLLSDEEKERYADLRAVYSFEATQRRVFPDPTDEQVAEWRNREISTREHPLVWTHADGRRSLVLGGHQDHVVGMEVEEGRALLDDLLDRATSPDRVYSHTWSVGDTVIWNNYGVYHRARPFDPSTRRRMHRTTILGNEPIR